MKTLPLLAKAILSLGLISASGPGLAQDDFSKVEISTEKVADGIYMLRGAGGNMGVSAGEDGVFLVDDQFAPLTDKIKAAIAELSDKPVRFVINTHWHGDHTGGNENLAKEGTVVMAHDNVYKRMSQEHFSEIFNDSVPAAAEGALPVVTFRDRVTFRLNNQEIRVVHKHHAHTDGDGIVLFTDANVIHTGDIFFNGFYPFIDVDSGGSAKGLVAAVDFILEHCDENTIIIPGHGPLSNCAELQAYRDMIATTSNRVQALVDQGKSLEEIKALKPNADYDEKRKGGFIDPDTYLRLLYMSATAK